MAQHDDTRVPPATSAIPGELAGPAASISDRRIKPRGVLPRSLQTWLMAGTAVVVVLIISDHGPSGPHAASAGRDPTRGRGPGSRRSHQELRAAAGRRGSAAAGRPRRGRSCRRPIRSCDVERVFDIARRRRTKRRRPGGRRRAQEGSDEPLCRQCRPLPSCRRAGLLGVYRRGSPLLAVLARLSNLARLSRRLAHRRTRPPRAGPHPSLDRGPGRPRSRLTVAATGAGAASRSAAGASPALIARSLDGAELAPRDLGAAHRNTGPRPASADPGRHRDRDGPAHAPGRHVRRARLVHGHHAGVLRRSPAGIDTCWRSGPRLRRCRPVVGRLTTGRQLPSPADARRPHVQPRPLQGARPGGGDGREGKRQPPLHAGLRRVRGDRRARGPLAVQHAREHRNRDVQRAVLPGRRQFAGVIGRLACSIAT